MTEANIDEGMGVPAVRAEGKYFIEIADADTGKVKRTYQSDNYITPLAYDQAVVLQGQMAGWNIRFPTETGSEGYNEFTDRMQTNPLSGPGVQPNHLICTDWNEAEDTTESWLKGNVVAYSPKVKTTAASTGKKGLVNETESNISTDGRVMTWVWDWSTTQGNGTFQTIAMGQIGTPSDTNPSVYTGVGQRGMHVQHDDATEVGVQSRFATDGTNMMHFMNVQGAPQIGWRDVTTDWASPTNLDDSGLWGQILIPTDYATDYVEPVGVTMFTTSTSSSSSTYYAACNYDVAYDGTDVYIVRVPNAGGQLWIHSFDKGTGVENYSQNSAPGHAFDTTYGGHSLSCTHLGGKLYVFYTDDNGTGTGTNLTDRRRFGRYTASTGVFEAFVDLDSELEANDRILSLANDGTDLIIETTSGIRKYTTGGLEVANSNVGSVRIQYSESNAITPGADVGNLGCWEYIAVAPDVTSYWWHLGPYRVTSNGFFPSRVANCITPENLFVTNSYSDRYIARTAISYNQTGFSLDSGSFSSTHNSLHGRVLYFGGRLWLYTPVSATTGTYPDAWDVWTGSMVYSVDGANMFSRTLLDAAVTKGATETMKITYQLTLPDDWSRPIAHVDPWA